jgi:hypothetical protein
MSLFGNLDGAKNAGKRSKSVKNGKIEIGEETVRMNATNKSTTGGVAPRTLPAKTFFFGKETVKF